MLGRNRDTGVGNRHVGRAGWDELSTDTHAFPREKLIANVELYIREGIGTPLQWSCLENPRDGEPAGLPSVGSHRVGHD